MKKGSVSKRCIIVYRGSLERSRLAFILQGLVQAHEKVVFIWVYPGKLTEEVQKRFDDFIKPHGLECIYLLNQQLSQFLKTRKGLAVLASQYTNYNLALIGDSASLLASGFKPLKTWWFINGIPEEAAMHSLLRNSLQSKFQWWLYSQSVKPNLIVTVSTRMSTYVKKHFPKVAIQAMPTCVDTATFSFRDNSKPRQPGLFVYLGTGAPWQALGKLSALWKAIHQQDKTIRFRVISRDPRCAILSTGIAPTHIEYKQSDNFSVVASFLQEAEVGFLIRENNIVNRVSFPTKLGEYLAAGCWVVASGIDWDISDYLDNYKVGIKVNPELSVDQVANMVLTYKRSLDWDEQSMRIAECAAVLDRKYWIDKLMDHLN